ncbi:pentapeptide repeat-containing protein [Microcoleus sp.]|uniref:pentapeptide repeat-containing protein n=1 Tax=Microcoleus sp. TaxID=44472 RepID=UPI0035239FF1
MANEDSLQEPQHSIQQILEAETNDFMELARIAGLDIATDFAGADLSGVDLSGADLSNADLSNANLSDANLSGVNLTLAKLSGADLSGADLRGTNLSKADLSGADLRGAKLKGVKLKGAKLSDAKLRDTDDIDANLMLYSINIAVLIGIFYIILCHPYIFVIFLIRKIRSIVKSDKSEISDDLIR